MKIKYININVLIQIPSETVDVNRHGICSSSTYTISISVHINICMLIYVEKNSSKKSIPDRQLSFELDIVKCKKKRRER
uniref:Uncharacterized protein n=1 Tax=Octopus bimaculoides TaxID=37653 RepID=A0A0L8GEE7_OCTBM